MQISNLIFTATTALGAGAGLYAQDYLIQHFPNGEKLGWTPTLVGAALGAVVGGGLKMVLPHPNPLPEVYRNLTTTRYRVVKQYETRTVFTVVQVMEREGTQRVVLKFPRLHYDWGKYSETHRNNWRQYSEFIRNHEYRILKKMDSPHVVRPLEPIEGKGYFIMVLEHLPGPTLRERVEETGPFELSETIEVMTAVAKCYRDIHSKGYAQGTYDDGDLNIILHPERKAVLVDMHSAYETDDPRNEMDSWAALVYKAGGWRKAHKAGKTIEEFLRENGCEDFVILNRARQLQTILDRAVGLKKGVTPYENYDALISDLETLVE